MSDLERVALVLVSHSARLAEGVAELAGQMAPDVAIMTAGGDDGGGLGTSFDRVLTALGEAGTTTSAGAVVLYDLGSALLTTESALEFLDPADAARIAVVDAPLVEGAVAAAVAAQGGAPLAEVAGAARGVPAPVAPAAAQPSAEPAPAAGPAAARTVRIRNALGLHARPAAELARALTGVDATVTLARAGQPAVDARSVLSVIGLATRAGEELTVSADGPDAALAVGLLAELIDSGFGEQ